MMKSNNTGEVERSELQRRTLLRLPPVSLFFAISGLCLIALAPWQVKWVGQARGWFTQPAFAPLMGLAVMTVFACARAVMHYRHDASSQYRAALHEHVSAFIAVYRIPAIIAAFFMIYLSVISVIGFAPASLVFLLSVLWLTDLANRYWCIVTVIAVIALVVIFRVTLGLWLPDAALYEFLPAYWRDLANAYF